MHCDACQRDVFPTIEHSQEEKTGKTRYMHMCPCGAFLGEVPNWRNSTAQNNTAPVPPAMGKNPGIQLQTRLVPGPTVPLAEKPEAQSVVDQIRARLAYLEDGHIEMEQAERKMLRKMLTASEPKHRTPKNVHPIGKKVAK